MSTPTTPLSTIPLPLSLNGPPKGCLNERDVFPAKKCCIVCGEESPQHCHISRRVDQTLWDNLKAHGWIPSDAKDDPALEPRNGVLMCPNHHNAFDNYEFFIRYAPNKEPQFVFVNFSGTPGLQQFHGKAVGLDIRDEYAPYPALFIIHEMRVREFYPFQPVNPDMPVPIAWQDWINPSNVLNDPSGSSNHGGNSSSAPSQSTSFSSLRRFFHREKRQ